MYGIIHHPPSFMSIMDSKTYGAVSDSSTASSFLRPSNNSTDHPSLGNLGSTTNGSNDETYHLIPPPPAVHAPVVRKAMSFEDALHQHVTGRHVRARTLTLLATITAVVLASAFWFYKNDDDSKGGSPSSTWKDSDLIPYGPSKEATTKNGTRAPFSTLHPVTDLGLYDFPRPKTSIPARPMIEGLTNRQSYPTNAWYQSLLMPLEEPTDLHRAYAIPYVVDTVGPVPGLRLHPNHIDASSFVIQLYVINEYGVTVGAAADASSSHHSSTTNNNLTHQYRVTQATPLGLTLNWVRCRIYTCIHSVFLVCSCSLFIFSFSLSPTFNVPF